MNFQNINNVQDITDEDLFESFNFGGNKKSPKSENKVNSGVLNIEKVQNFTANEVQELKKVQHITPPIEENFNKVQSFTDNSDQNERKVQSFTDSVAQTAQNVQNFTEGMTYVGPIPNSPTRKFYPERVFDKYAKKDCRLEESDLEFLRAWSNQIAYKRKKMHLNSSSARVTDNSVIRILLSEFISVASLKSNEAKLNSVLTEDDLRCFIRELLS